MSKRTFRRTAKVLRRWCEDIHAKQPDECVVVYFNGPWILEIFPSGLGNPPVNTLTDWRLLGLRMRDLASWLVRHSEFEGLDGREEDFEWRLYRGAY